MPEITIPRYWVLKEEGRKVPDDVVQVLLESGGYVQFSRLGGGMVHNAVKESFLIRHREVSIDELNIHRFEPGAFGIEDGPYLYGYTGGRRWNGWHIPWVEAPTLLAWEDACSKLGYQSVFRFEDGKGFHKDLNEDEEYPLEQVDAMIDGQIRRLYEIGCGMIWSMMPLEKARREVRAGTIPAVVYPADLAHLGGTLKPKSCPFCGSTEVSHATDREHAVDPNTDTELDEYQCTGSCGRSFWI